MYHWPETFHLARAYLDQMERDGDLESTVVQRLRRGLRMAEGESGAAQTEALNRMANRLSGMDNAKVQMFVETVRGLAG